MSLLIQTTPRFTPLTDEQKIAMGYSLVTADVSFFHPEKPWLICGNTYTQQLYDLVPELPELNELVKKWTAAGIRIETVKIASQRGMARITAVDGLFRVH